MHSEAITKCMNTVLGKRYTCSCGWSEPSKEPKLRFVQSDGPSSEAWSTKHLHERKEFFKVESDIRRIVSWNRFLILVSTDGNVLIYKSGDELAASIPFPKYDAPALMPNGNQLLIFGIQDTRQMLWLIDDSSFSKKDLLEVPLEDIYGFTGCIWNDVIILGKDTQLAVISLKQDSEQLEILELQARSMISANNSLWVTQWDHTKMYKHLDQLRNDTGKICYKSTAHHMCFWKHYDLVVLSYFSSLELFENTTGKSWMCFDDHVASITSICDWNDRLYTSSTDGEIRVWNVEGKCLDIINLRTAIDCLCVHDNKLWVTCGKNVMYYKSRRPWKVLRLIWLAHLKNDPKFCPMSMLPKDMLKLIILQL